ncbi:putative lanosterol synthase [Dimargaris cristalligena]|uniref:Terpene cyclase/mutase family member n=1 Tax=Dimargaris cristalligena TaxID=215637 RepID=A0A4V1J599_9FUNG|nr:putative lanosterol synthase [Dimargaris cristalligena]|eukprot:RKP38319.1 putative lanosterol synthase [Dimargaris cristalligena]
MATRSYPPPLHTPIRLAKLRPTDPRRWRLRVNKGRQLWDYLESDELVRQQPQSDIERYWLGLPVSVGPSAAPSTPMECARKGFAFFRNLQTEDGHWAGRYDGPMFMIPGVVIALYCVRERIPEYQRIEFIRYILGLAHPEDGGWGIHSESISTVFGTCLNYITLRILGVGPDEEPMIKARNTLHALGGAIAIPAWGKFWLSILGTYKYEGMNPVPPELSLLPYWVPVHPGRFWVHTRQVYLSMAYLYGQRYVTEETLLTQQLKEEIYVQPFNTIDWSNNRNNVAPVDLYSPSGPVTHAANYLTVLFEKINPTWVRNQALDEVLRQIMMEEENTSGLDLAPVNYAINIVTLAVGKGKDSFEYRRHMDRLGDAMWMSEDGLMVNGTNGSQLWDTGFAVQAAVETGLADDPANHECMQQTLSFLDVCQIRADPPYYREAYRFSTKGAWPFSTFEQGYTVSDCTAEGLQAVLLLQDKPYTKNLVDDQRLFDAVDLLLTMQNEGGGFASYELVRSPEWIEFINPAEIFGKYMIEYAYPECTTSVVLGLRCFNQRYPQYRSDDIETCITDAVRYIFNSQESNGGWFGSWGVCFTYAGMFALKSLSCEGYTYDNCPKVKKACEFFISKQKPDGGWGESYKSCETGEYVQHEKSQVVQTAWSLLGLMAAKYPDRKPLERGIQLIMSRQQPNGEWLQESLEGVFSKNCTIAYPNFKNIFTVWALGKFANLYDNPKLA